jgi:hypothetical protein
VELRLKTNPVKSFGFFLAFFSDLLLVTCGKPNFGLQIMCIASEMYHFAIASLPVV